jgi:P27 family predicted phage terminase small subunit
MRGAIKKMSMKPMAYLTKEGEAIFKKIFKFIKEKNLQDDIDSFSLSMLANSLDLYHRAATAIKENGYSQRTQSGYSQTTADYTVLQKELANILQLSRKFGLTPYDRAKLLEMAEPEEEEEPDALSLI